MLDFLVVGAQKAGTTAVQWSLSKSAHFQVPKGKELPVLDRSSPPPVLERELLRLFGGERTTAGSLPPYHGKVTPHYLTSSIAPTNIAAVTPGASLIVVLRDPWERAFSHYRMAVGRGIERRPFLAAIDAEARMLGTHNLRLPEFGGYADTNYLAGGLYGALLTRYIEAGLRERLTILDHHTMRTDWASFATAFCHAVDPAADADILPPPPPKNVTYGGRNLSDFATKLAGVPGMRHAARVVPRRFRHALWWRLNDVSLRPSRAQGTSEKPPPLSDASRPVLEVLKDDAERLRTLQLRGTVSSLLRAPGTEE